MQGESSSIANGTNNSISNDNNDTLSLGDRYHRAAELSESSPQEAVGLLEQMQEDVARLALFSSNESLEEISTKSLPLIALEHVLAMAYTRVPTERGRMEARKLYLWKAIDLWVSFLQRLQTLGQEICTQQEQKEYQHLMDYTHHFKTNSEGENKFNINLPPPPTPNRDEKIARYRAKQDAQNELQRLCSLRERRQRIGVSAEEVLDEFDEENLDRSVAMTNLLLQKAEALEEWTSTLRELPMVERMCSMEQQQLDMNRRKENSQRQQHSFSHESINSRQDPRPPPPPAPSQGLNVTHVTLDAASGQLQFRKEEIKSQIFRPGWNQPTMTLGQLAERETADAIAREQRQKQAEAKRAQGPRRYEQLEKDGMEDDQNKVDASAAVDRAWDDWKDDNPRGSGNKRGDQGDRNF